MSFLAAASGYVLKGRFLFRDGHTPSPGHPVADDFIGICVATAPDRASDEYVLESLLDLGIRRVRLDYTYDSPDNHVGRLLDALLEASFDVLLHLVQPKAAAAGMETATAQRQWREFVSRTLDRYGGRVAAVEVGATVNRRRWAGYTLQGFITAWSIAHELARERAVVLAGPNVTDYEPLYTVGLLGVMSRRGVAPDVYTNNLFVERAIEPEAYDRKLLGALLHERVKYNLIKKARELRRIAARYDVTRLWNGYVSWTFPRIERFLPNTEQKQADYLVRYLVLAAASGALDRVYWGPLISLREGLVDDPNSTAPNEELVNCYHRVWGPVKDYRRREAFHALRWFVAAIPGSYYEGAALSGEGLEVHSFIAGRQRVQVLWVRNGAVADMSSLYRAQDLQQALCHDIDGTRLRRVPCVVTERPLYLSWPVEHKVVVDTRVRPVPGLVVSLLEAGGDYCPVGDERWRGMVVARNREHATELFAAMHPERIADLPRQKLLRKARNAIWVIRDPVGGERLLAVKQPINLRWYKRWLELRKPSKARRSWNGACQLLRRGIHTPRPVAYLERNNTPGLTQNWYVCEYQSGCTSVREFFGAYAAGYEEVEGYRLRSFLEQLVPFLVDLHARGVYFRDLSGGNVLVWHRTDGELGFSLIDTARARFLARLNIMQRLSDLKRLCHKLHWNGRVELLEMYFQAIGRAFGLPYRVPFYLYDLKAFLKRSMRGKRKPARL